MYTIATKLIRDFNSPILNWVYDEHQPGTMVCSNDDMSPAESKILAFAAQQRLTQINNYRNQRGAFLDLSFTSRFDDCKIAQPSTDELIEPESVSHNAMELIINFKGAATKDIGRTLYTFTSKSKKINGILNTTQITWLTEEELSTADFNQVEKRIDEIMVKLRSIREENIVRRVKNLPPDMNTQTWCKDKRYAELFKVKKKLRAKYLVNQTEHNKDALREANINLYNHYKDLKMKFNRKMIENMTGDAEEVYHIMRNRMKSRRSLPLVMYKSNARWLLSFRSSGTAIIVSF